MKKSWNEKCWPLVILIHSFVQEEDESMMLHNKNNNSLHYID